ncbi:MAG: hypothetical protein LBD17_05560 [Endomicrobium sp.]|jgi:hypothetical protein|nr:hypothetical protein [Endomicrobium sp.]
MKKIFDFLCCLLITVFFCNCSSCARKGDSSSNLEIRQINKKENPAIGELKISEIPNKGSKNEFIPTNLVIEIKPLSITLTLSKTAFVDLSIDGGTFSGDTKLITLTSDNPTDTANLTRIGKTKLGDDIFIGQLPGQKGYDFSIFVAYPNSSEPSKPSKIADAKPSEVISFHTEESSNTGVGYKYIRTT